jgi:hypothetical protein
MKIRRTGVAGGVYVFAGLGGALVMEPLERDDGTLLFCSAVCFNWFRRDAKPDIVLRSLVVVKFGAGEY